MRGTCGKRRSVAFNSAYRTYAPYSLFAFPGLESRYRFYRHFISCIKSLQLFPCVAILAFVACQSHCNHIQRLRSATEELTTGMIELTARAVANWRSRRQSEVEYSIGDQTGLRPGKVGCVGLNLELHRTDVKEQVAIGVSSTVANQPGHCMSNGNGGRGLARRNMRDGRKNGAINASSVIKETTNLFLENLNGCICQIGAGLCQCNQA